MNPRHADLLVADVDEQTAIKYIDRLLAYYIQTADKLTRTSVWLEKMEGGIEYLREIIIGDKLGICDELERQIQFLVDTYKCEWKEVVNDPEKRKRFRQFANTDEIESSIEFVYERGQQRPADWPSEFVSIEQVKLLNELTEEGSNDASTESWVKVGMVTDFPKDGGMAVKYGKVQLAVFNFASRGEWYATQNMCPHKKTFVLSRGMIGNAGEVPKVACPLHKKTFSLESGECTSGDDYLIRTFSVNVQDDEVFVKLPPEEEINKTLSTDIGCKLATSCNVSPERQLA